MEILRNINEISVYLFYVCYIILFYASLKKCFLREGYSKVKLFFLSLITNPFFMFAISTFFSAIIVFVRESLELGLDISSTADWDYLINVQFDRFDRHYDIYYDNRADLLFDGKTSQGV